ncbi:hypothetical protein G7Y89_g544 [Cudoniella acicularis]|uniref:SET domain-containing protein n=1 Tax=Cudoniella acicularis TaxID=354080 RepID=A0A8H4RX06_9HELO|nr:hypothetical protein G7Y89_g544 [Cudoniella acicularis]
MLLQVTCILVKLSTIIIICASAAIASSLLSPQHCANEAYLLSTNLACGELGSGDLLSTIGRAGVELFVKNRGPAYFHPWSFDPLCTPVLEKLDSEVCVYTNASFGMGRGISILTTPAIAKKFASLPPFQDELAIKKADIAGKPWSTRQIEGKGIGMIASRDLKRGDLITSTTPVLLVYPSSFLRSSIMELLLRRAIEQLPRSSQDAYLNLATIFGDEAVKIQDVLKANTFEVQVGGVMHLAVFPEQSRMNHDCGPNAQYYIDHERLTHYVHATRPILKGEEITISYTDPLQPTSDRQKHLKVAFHFTCSCSRCSSASESDSILRQITQLVMTLSNIDYKYDGTPEMAEKLIKLHEHEGLEGFMAMAYSLAALTYSSIGDEQGTIFNAQKAWEVSRMRNGPGMNDDEIWKDAIENPRELWNWGKALKFKKSEM